MTEESISIIGSPAKAIAAIKDAFKDFSHLEIKAGLGELSHLGGEFGAAIIGGMTGYFLFRVMRNENVKPHQKIIPTIGYALGLAAAIAVVVVVIAGAATLIPPFMFAASVVGTIRNISLYLEERAERKNLRRELIGIKDLLAKVKKVNTSEENKQKILSYMLEPRDIYLELYDLRESIITSDKISPEKKSQLVDSINHTIENFSKENNEPIQLNSEHLPEEMKAMVDAQMSMINRRMDKYQRACNAVKEMNLSKSLLKSIDNYKFTQEKIFSQDLPKSIKMKMVELMENKKTSEKELNELYLRIGNHYLNNTSDYQLNVLDDSLKKRMMKYVKNVEDTNKCVIFYKKPREVYSLLHALRHHIENHEFAESTKKETLLRDLRDFIDLFKKNPSNTKELISNFERKFASEGLPISELIQPVLNQLEILDNVNTDFYQSEIFVEAKRIQDMPQKDKKQLKKLARINALIHSIEEHQLNGLQQYSSQFGQQFPSPKIEIDYAKYNLIEKIKKSKKKSDKDDERAEKSLLSKKMESIAKYAKSGPLKKLFKEYNEVEERKKALNKQLEGNEYLLQRDFKDRFAGTFNVMGKIERLCYLENSVPKRLINIGLSTVVAFASLALTFIIPAVASPAAPVAAAATAALGAISTAFSVTCVAIGIDIMARDIKTKIKLGRARTDIVEGIIPSMSEDEVIKPKKESKKSKILKRILPQNKNNPPRIAAVIYSEKNGTHKKDEGQEAGGMAEQMAENDKQEKSSFGKIK